MAPQAPIGVISTLTVGVGAVISYIRTIGMAILAAELKWLPELDTGHRLKGIISGLSGVGVLNVRRQRPIYDDQKPTLSRLARARLARDRALQALAAGYFRKLAPGRHPEPSKTLERTFVGGGVQVPRLGKCPSRPFRALGRPAQPG